MLLFWMGLQEVRSLKSRRKREHGVEVKLNLSVPGRRQNSFTKQLPQNHYKLSSYDSHWESWTFKEGQIKETHHLLIISPLELHQ